MRSGAQARLFYRYSEERGAVEKIAESDKSTEQKVIDNIRRNYK